jgi:hypothetical protein
MNRVLVCVATTLALLLLPFSLTHGQLPKHDTTTITVPLVYPPAIITPPVPRPVKRPPAKSGPTPAPPTPPPAPSTPTPVVPAPSIPTSPESPSAPPPQPASPRPTFEQVRAAIYTAIIGHIYRQEVGEGSNFYRGRRLGSFYPDTQLHKAIAICLNWNEITPSQVQIPRTGHWRFVTGNGICGQTPQEARRCALGNCITAARCSPGQRCTIVDIDGQNAVEIPRPWTEHHFGRR